jgi:hypothetical protein
LERLKTENKHKWQWCWGCGSNVKCGNCGNNCCNGMEKCDDCKTAYIVQNTTNPPLYLRIAEWLSFTKPGNAFCTWKFHKGFRRGVKK